MLQYDVISFGSAIVDFFISADTEQFKSVDDQGLVCLPLGEKVEIDTSFISTGGGGTNTAVSFARQGLTAGIVARLGSDPLGQVIINDLTAESVDRSLLSIKPEQTDFSIIVFLPDGKRTILVCRGDSRLTNEDIAWEKLDSGWFYVSSLEGNLDLVEEIIKFGNDKNIKIAWNPGKKELVQKDRIISLAKQVEVFNVNRAESEALFGFNLDQDDFWEKAKRLSLANLVVTDGRNGAYLLTEGEKIFLPSPDQDPVDETGAGDAFGSGFVCGLIKGLSKRAAFELAMANGASVVKFLGAKKGLLKSS